MTARRAGNPQPPRRLSHIRPKPLTVRRLSGPTRRGTAAPTPDRRNAEARESLVRRVRHEFEEMPGMRLTPQQACRLFGLRQDVCARILDELAVEGALLRMLDGSYIRRRAS